MSTYKNANYAINRIGGEGVGSKAGQGIYEESSTPKYDLGEKLELKDGRVFRYASVAATTAAGDIVSQDVSDTGLIEVENGMTAAAVGATDVIITSSELSSATANQFAGGYLHTVDDAGEGFTYRIKSNTAASSNAVTFTLYDAIVVAITTATDAAITGNLYGSVRPALGSADYIAAGVAPRAFTANYYGWVQTRGIATVQVDAAVTIGLPLMLSDEHAGQAEAADNTHPLIGFATFAQNTADGFTGVALQLP